MEVGEIEAERESIQREEDSVELWTADNVKGAIDMDERSAQERRNLCDERVGSMVIVVVVVLGGEKGGQP